jgi:hypothetical protein
MKDKTLFPLPPATANLSDRQSIVLAYLQAHPDGRRAIDVGNWLHREKANACPVCSEGTTCRWASGDANDVLRDSGPKGLRARGLVRYRRDPQVWVALVGVDDGRMDPRNGVIPF